MNKFEKFKSIYNLPKEKNLLDYIYGKLCEKKEEADQKVILNFFEMHRTSAGFDPVRLSKVRFKRMKVADYLTFLTELETSIQKILESEEYRQLKNKSTSDYAQLLSRFVHLQSKMEMNVNNDVEKDINELKRELISHKEYELLLSLNKLCRNFYQQQLMESRMPEAMNEYQLVLDLISKNMVEYSY